MPVGYLKKMYEERFMRFRCNSEKISRNPRGPAISKMADFATNLINRLNLDKIVAGGLIPQILSDFKYYFPNYATVGDWEESI